jgi:hypothetical protein
MRCAGVMGFLPSERRRRAFFVIIKAFLCLKIESRENRYWPLREFTNRRRRIEAKLR